MLEFSVQKKAQLISFWKKSNSFLFGGLKHILLLFIIAFMIGAITLFLYVGDSLATFLSVDTLL